MKFSKLLSEKLFHKHNWEKIKESIGRSNFQGIAGDDVPNVRVKAVKEKCKTCKKERAYLIDGHGTHYPIDSSKIK
jgi:hypothetical protein